MNKKILIITLLVLAIDLLSKYIAFMFFQEPISIIPNVFRFMYATNTGAAWSLFNNFTFVLDIISVIILIIIYLYSKSFKKNIRNNIAFGILYGGILGNLFNRIYNGFVIDFIDIKIFSYDYPVFNIADSAIVVGIILLIISIIKGEDNEVKSRNR